jgi:putative tryptophan/tyrosine transport system substrate-binding protein
MRMRTVRIYSLAITPKYQPRSDPTLAIAARLSAIYNAKEHVEAGGLVSYGANHPDLYRRAAEYVDEILRGRTERPSSRATTKFDLIINLITAKALDVPPSLIARADEVIE